MGEWDKRPSVEKLVIGAHSCSGIPFGPLWLQCLSQAMLVCVPVTECVYFCPSMWEYVLHQVQSVCCYSCNLLRAESRTEWGIRILKTSLGTSGCDWQEKKGSLCSGNWQQMPDPTQYNPAQYSTEPAKMKKKKKKTPTVGLLPFTPPYAWPVLIIPQQSPWQHFL